MGDGQVGINYAIFPACLAGPSSPSERGVDMVIVHLAVQHTHRIRMTAFMLMSKGGGTSSVTGFHHVGVIDSINLWNLSNACVLG